MRVTRPLRLRGGVAPRNRAKVPTIISKETFALANEPLEANKKLGPDGWRWLGGRVCDNRQMRQGLLDEVVWKEIALLLEDRHLIEDEFERRLTAARNADLTQRPEETLRRDPARSRKSVERLLTAYQGSHLSLEELRSRMPNLRSCEQACLSALQAIENQ
ncbi:hypothetical protein AAFG07_32610 [Bradyrhizobium sp. B097]|uniref:hypothetical protein n=1 Tax=Bradyrhizobium sp. B097 TaxID=3140244 RepID=UPI00318356F7